MKINIVCKTTGTQILIRQAAELVKFANWSISDRSRNDVDYNYAFPYLELRKKYNKPFVAFFTHRENTTSSKVSIWKSQAKRCSLRIAECEMYKKDLEQYGPTVKVIPSINREKFTIKEREHQERKELVIGISGFVCNNGRKGEHLIRSLKKSAIFNQFEWKAAGRNWPIETIEYSWERLQEFYQSLDIYLCTSLIEGVPYGPLEAMACGVRCIIPKHVGLLDELPNLPDLIRYQRGDAQSLEEALNKVLSMEIDPDKQALRKATEKFNTFNWVNGHLRAFSILEKNRRSYWIKMENKESDYGIGIVAYGKPALNCASRLIKSIRNFMPNCPVALISNESLGEEDYFIKYPDLDIGGRTAKTSIVNLIPKHWKHGLYLDADTEIIADVSFIFKALKAGWDMVITKDIDLSHTPQKFLNKHSNEKRLSLPIIKTDKVLALAGGVIGFSKNKRVKNFFNNWYIEWRKLGHKDQGALLRAYFKNPVKLLVLGTEWNSFDKYFARKSSAGIIHYTGAPARRWGKGYERNFNLATSIFAPEVKINEKDFDKVFLCNAIKTFASGNKLIRRGSEFKTNGKIINELIGYKLAFPISQLNEKINEDIIIISKEAKI